MCDYNAELLFNDLNFENLEQNCIARIGEVLGKIFNKDIRIFD